MQSGGGQRDGGGRTGRPWGRYEPRHANGRHRWPAKARGPLLAIVALCTTGFALVAVERLPTPARVGNVKPVHLQHPVLNGQRHAPVRVAASVARNPPTALESSAVSLGFSPSSVAVWVQNENARTGSRDWQLTKPATAHQIEGYAGTVSVEPGQPGELFVSTDAPTYGVEAFRMGYYGGTRARLVWSAASLPGYPQPNCLVASKTRTVQCNWKHPVEVDTTGWIQGDYLFKLVASTGWQSYIPLTVRDDASRSAYLVNNSVTTWEAYNLYGGRNLYTGPTLGGRSTLAGRSEVVSFDRPYSLGNGAGDFVGLELPVVSMMESLGLDVSYTTDVDVSEDPQTVLEHRAFVSLGHDEYFTLAMRQGLTAARDAGVNLVFLGANAAYRHIRLEPSASGPDRLEVDYKDPYLDPLLGKENADVTPWAWRDPPNKAPESELLGEMWQCNPVRADMIVTDPSDWIYANTGLHTGSRITGIVGPEYDHFDPYSPNPGDVTVVARSPVRCDGHAEEADMTYYTAPSGSGVWDTGTIDWVGTLLPYCLSCGGPDAVTKITTNVLAAFGAGPSGLAHPSEANVFRSSKGAVPTTLPPTQNE